MSFRKILLGAVLAFCMLASSPVAKGQTEISFGVGLVNASTSSLGGLYNWDEGVYNSSLAVYRITTPYQYTGTDVLMATGYSSYSSSSTTAGGFSPELYFGYAKYLTPKVKAFSRTGFTQRKTSVNQVVTIYDAGWHDWTCYQNWTHRGSYLSETLGFSYETRSGLSFNFGATYYLGVGASTQLDYSYRNNIFPSESSAGNLKLSSAAARLWYDEIIPTWGVSYRKGAFGVDLQMQMASGIYVSESNDVLSPLKYGDYEPVETQDESYLYTSASVTATTLSFYYSIFNLK